MKKIYTKIGDVMHYYHKFTNTTEDILAISDLISFSGQRVTPREEDKKVPVPLRWVSSEENLIIPHNGKDIVVPRGSFVTVNSEDKKIEVYSITGFGVIFKHE